MSWLRRPLLVPSGWLDSQRSSTSTDESLESLGVEVDLHPSEDDLAVWPMLSRFERFNQTRKDKDHRSNSKTKWRRLCSAGPDLQFDYTLHRRYCPDFKIGDVYIEVKGVVCRADEVLSVIRNNPDLRIFVALQRPPAVEQTKQDNARGLVHQERHRLEPDTDSA